ncbi:MAG: hypothetical protein KGJ34_02960 [Patescibacteria group bacterium]|nr:hypothetical protein [Patescibacteria group bacterium]
MRTQHTRREITPAHLALISTLRILVGFYGYSCAEAAGWMGIPKDDARVLCRQNNIVRGSYHPKIIYWPRGVQIGPSALWDTPERANDNRLPLRPRKEKAKQH